MADPLVFTEEVLRAQHGKKVPVTDRPGGRVIGEATMRYVEETGVLEADYRIDDPDLAEFLEGSRPIFKIKKES
jgi:hypothetical protein